MFNINASYMNRILTGSSDPWAVGVTNGLQVNTPGKFAVSGEDARSTSYRLSPKFLPLLSPKSHLKLGCYTFIRHCVTPATKARQGQKRPRKITGGSMPEASLLENDSSTLLANSGVSKFPSESSGGKQQKRDAGEVYLSTDKRGRIHEMFTGRGRQENDKRLISELFLGDVLCGIRRTRVMTAAGLGSATHPPQRSPAITGSEFPSLKRQSQAYHDMATHNITDGTGGLDASIRFAEEQARAENVGDGFDNTFSVLTGFSTRYVSVADILALGTVIAVEFCGGPQIPFRGGRVDATEPNLPGVPEPEQTLDSHIAAFAKQGFTQDEMIALVACGHTFGGVQHAPFPDIVPELNDPNSTESVAHFDTTNTHFDNNIAMEYISGTTQNPLVVGLNDTTNSDKRIFGSDGNVTMLSFANSPEIFASRCSELFARMLDTVPSGVQLSDVITPLPVKPTDPTFTLDGDVLQFSGRVRFWNLTDNPNRVALLLWDDHLGGVHNSTLLSTVESVGSYPDGVATSSGLSLDAAAGITNMRFMVDGQLEDQGGVGFAVQDAVVFSTTSCFLTPISRPNTTSHHDPVQVRKDVNVTSVYIETEDRDSSGHVAITETNFFSPDSTVALNAAYTIWTLNLAGSPDTRYVGAEIDGVKYSMPLFTPLPAFPLVHPESTTINTKLIIWERGYKIVGVSLSYNFDFKFEMDLLPVSEEAIDNLVLCFASSDKRSAANYPEGVNQERDLTDGHHARSRTQSLPSPPAHQRAWRWSQRQQSAVVVRRHLMGVPIATRTRAD
ncbi:heme peroxidase [Mycena galopus ATCC 62051]|nr:heme peroxidase [Mycena galopus ATCC 62051]